jgi:hypothetical protein
MDAIHQCLHFFLGDAHELELREKLGQVACILCYHLTDRVVGIPYLLGDG